MENPTPRPAFSEEEMRKIVYIIVGECTAYQLCKIINAIYGEGNATDAGNKHITLADSLATIFLHHILQTTKYGGPRGLIGKE